MPTTSMALELMDPEVRLEELRFEFVEVTEGREKLAVLTHAVGPGRGSAAEVDWTFTTVWASATG